MRESKTPRDHIPKLNAWEMVKERNLEQMEEGKEPEEEHCDSHTKPSFDKERYMKNNCINHRTKLQLDQVQSQESKPSRNIIEIELIESGNFQSRGWITQRSTRNKDEGHKLSVKQFNRNKSNSSLKLDPKNLKPTSSYKILNSKTSTNGKSSSKNINSKRNKSYDYFKKKTQPARQSKEYRRIKDYIQAKSYQKLGQKNNSENYRK